MFPVRTILHPTDFSASSQYALHMACALARDYGARLILVHVVAVPTTLYGEGTIFLDWEDSFAEAKERLDAFEMPDDTIHADRRLMEGETPARRSLRVAQNTGRRSHRYGNPRQKRFRTPVDGQRCRPGGAESRVPGSDREGTLAPDHPGTGTRSRAALSQPSRLRSLEHDGNDPTETRLR